MEKEKFKCPNCEHEITMNLNEFVDVSTDPEFKEKIMNGEFFLIKCPECGDETLVEYQVMYMDPDKKLTIYMAPEHEADLLEQLNSLEVPEGDLDEEAIFRVVGNSAELLEKILLADGGRDDRVMELYKAIIVENMKEEWPDVKIRDLLYFFDNGEEYFIIWDYDNAAGEQLTVNVDDELYTQLKDDYLAAKTANVNSRMQSDIKRRSRPTSTPRSTTSGWQRELTWWNRLQALPLWQRFDIWTKSREQRIVMTVRFLVDIMYIYCVVFCVTIGYNIIN